MRVRQVGPHLEHLDRLGIVQGELRLVLGEDHAVGLHVGQPVGEAPEAGAGAVAGVAPDAPLAVGAGQGLGGVQELLDRPGVGLPVLLGRGDAGPYSNRSRLYQVIQGPTSMGRPYCLPCMRSGSSSPSGKSLRSNWRSRPICVSNGANAPAGDELAGVDVVDVHDVPHVPAGQLDHHVLAVRAGNGGELERDVGQVALERPPDDRPVGVAVAVHQAERGRLALGRQAPVRQAGTPGPRARTRRGDAVSRWSRRVVRMAMGVLAPFCPFTRPPATTGRRAGHDANPANPPRAVAARQTRSRCPPGAIDRYSLLAAQYSATIPGQAPERGAALGATGLASRAPRAAGCKELGSGYTSPRCLWRSGRHCDRRRCMGPRFPP